MSRRIVLASRNPKKVAELSRILDAAQLDIEVLGADAYADLPDIVEDGSSFIQNAIIKAEAVAAHTGLPAVADDSGLCVDALNAMPGIFSARWAGANASDENNLALVLEQIADVQDARRGASFRCAAAVAVPGPDGSIVLSKAVEGEVVGTLRRAPVGENGFGYDPVFEPEGHDVTTAQMTPSQKDAISHRGQAFRALAPILEQVLFEG